MNYPKIHELPAMLDTSAWQWECREINPFYKKWIATDPKGTCWLVKMTGSFYSYREHVFSRLAQHIGISCQSSAYIILPDDSPPMSEDGNDDKYQLAIYFYPVHSPEPCMESCPKIEFERFRDADGDSPSLSIVNAVDYWNVNCLAYIFGANEGGEEYIITPDHKLIMIDNEQMFSFNSPALPYDFWKYSERRRGKLIELCRKISAVSDDEIDSFLALPAGYQVDHLWDIREILIAGRDYCQRHIKNLSTLLGKAHRKS